MNEKSSMSEHLPIQSTPILSPDPSKIQSKVCTIPFHLIYHHTWYNAVIAGSLDWLSPRQFNADCSCLSLAPVEWGRAMPLSTARALRTVTVLEMSQDSRFSVLIVIWWVCNSYPYYSNAGVSNHKFYDLPFAAQGRCNDGLGERYHLFMSLFIFWWLYKKI